MAFNDITGHLIATRLGDKEAQDKFNANFDKIFGEKPKKEKYIPPPLPTRENEYPEEEYWDEERIDRIGANGALGLHYK
jgi:hypothetical protein